MISVKFKEVTGSAGHRFHLYEAPGHRFPAVDARPLMHSEAVRLLDEWKVLSMLCGIGNTSMARVVCPETETPYWLLVNPCGSFILEGATNGEAEIAIPACA